MYTYLLLFPDIKSPAINNIPVDITIPTNPGSPNATASWTPPLASDNFGAVSLTSSHSPGDSFPLGTTVVNYTATDANDHQAHDSFKVTVLGEYFFFNLKKLTVPNALLR